MRPGLAAALLALAVPWGGAAPAEIAAAGNGAAGTGTEGEAADAEAQAPVGDGPDAGAPDAAAAGIGAAAALQAAVARLRAAEAEGAGGRARVEALAAAIAAYEAGLSGLRAGLRAAALREAAIARRFEAESTRLSRLLGVLTALERTEGPLLLLHPAGPLGTVRSAMLVADVAPALQAEVAALRVDLEALQAIRTLREDAAATLEEGLVAVQDARAALGRAIADRAALPPPVSDDAAALALLARGVETLAAFAAGLAALPAPAEAASPAPGAFAAARGSLPLPVQGSVLRRAGEADAAGIRRPGLVLAARSAALVTAPWAGSVRYAGPLLDYGNVMVLEPEAPYLLVLAGLDLVYAGTGEVVAAGAPLGLLGGRDAAAAEFLARARQGGGEAGETLYIELRRGGDPVDPAEWFALTRE